MDVKEILKHVDHTLLLQPSTWEEIKQICDDAMKYGTASVISDNNVNGSLVISTIFVY